MSENLSSIFRTFDDVLSSLEKLDGFETNCRALLVYLTFITATKYSMFYSYIFSFDCGLSVNRIYFVFCITCFFPFCLLCDIF